MAINEETRIHGSAVLKLFEALGKEIPEINFSLKTGESRNSYVIEAIRPSIIGKGTRLAIGLYIKSSQKVRSPWSYNYIKQHQNEIAELKSRHGEVFNVYVNGTDGFACINFSELKRFLDEEHEEQEWIRIRRKRNEAYRVAGNDGRDEMALRMNNFPNAIVDYFRENL